MFIWQKQQLLRILEEEEDMMRLVTTVYPGDMSLIKDEVDRRTEIFKKHWKEGTRRHSETPRRAATQSVYNDVTRGWL